MKWAIRKDINAQQLIFEEIIGFMVIVIALTVFLVVMTNSMNDYKAQRQDADLQNECMKVSRMVLTYEGFVSETQPKSGHFDEQKLNDTSSRDLARYLGFRVDDPEANDYHFRVEIYRLGDEASGSGIPDYEYQDSSFNVTADIFSYEWPINIIRDKCDVQNARMVVYVWEALK